MTSIDLVFLTYVILVQFLAYVNKMALSYESDTRKDKLHVKEARKKAMEFTLQLDEVESKHASEQERASKRIRDSEAKMKLHKEKRNQADEQILRLESSKDRQDAHIATLSRQMEMEQALHEISVKRVVKVARREAVAKFQEIVS